MTDKIVCDHCYEESDQIAHLAGMDVCIDCIHKAAHKLEKPVLKRMPNGVRFNGSSYQAILSVHGEKVSLGSFKSVDAAYAAVKEKKAELAREKAAARA